MELSGSEVSSVINFGSDAEMPEDPIEEPVYLGRKREKFYKMILERGEGIDKPGTIDEVTIRYCDFSEDLSSKPFQTLQLGQGHLADYIEKGIVSMKKNEAIDLHVPEAMTKSEAKIIKIELINFINIHDLHADKMLFKKVLEKSTQIDRISYKDEVKINLSIIQGDELLSEILDYELIVGVSICHEGLVEILTTMKETEYSEITVKLEYFKEKFMIDVKGNQDPIVRIRVLKLVKLTDIYVNGGFFKKILSPGNNISPYPHSQIEFEYKAQWDSQEIQGIMTAYLDENQIPSLWEDCLKQMKEGEYSHIECFPNDKSKNLKDGLIENLNIPSDTPVLYFRLIRIISGSALYEMEDEDKKIMAIRMKAAGTSLFRCNLFAKAIEKYDIGLGVLNPVKDNLDLFLDLYTSLQLNVALSFSKQKDYRNCIIRCDRVLEHNPKDIKTIYRKASALKYMFEYTQANEVFQKALDISREKGDMQAEKDILKELEQVKELEINYKKKEKKLYAGLFK
ncbi:hypothetical protein SteCoe_12525 [Stentor coeruleus]|uniref:peptidylprolyl isomerase n=1 Tax=Stentor coeruleus TaxID=5963 RepID=A0A1R2CAJ5_9CILI|nr:hypothetical protein SteCoe_12525 [Stentor coeruleus]